MADPLTIERKVFFFRVDVGLIDDGSLGKLKAFNAGPIAKFIAAKTASERQLRRTDGKLTFCRVYRSDKPQRLMLTSISESDFPESFKLTDSTFRDIEMAEDEGIALTSHFSFFDKNIVGMVAPYRGPGAGRLEEYLEKKVHEDAPNLKAKVTLTPLTTKDFESKLNKFESIKALYVRVSNYELEGYESSNQEDTSAVGILRDMRGIGQAGEYEIGWKPKKNTRGHIPEQFIDLARRLLRRNDVLKDDSAKLVVKGTVEEGRTEEVNLLDGKVFFEARVMKQSERSRALAPGTAFEAIRQVYEDNREYLEEAAAIYT